MAKQPQPQQPSPLQDTTAATIKALTDKINRLEAGTNTVGGGRGSSRGDFVSNGKDGVRTRRRWDNDNYCWTCGFDVKHTSSNCKYIKDTTDHKTEATVTNTMGGSTRNLHLRA